MSKKSQIIFSRYNQLLEQMGEQIKLARKRRKLTTIQVAERAGARSNLYLIEKGDASVAFAAFFNVLIILGLKEDILKGATEFCVKQIRYQIIVW
ncbi:helix-turn-helix domain-containing protein [Sphingobacterium sp. SG20118]|uniref:helix-turn-helix domain-containing protein n=1 Tax=Sphingobacterium sp. SG20118 TaxID=3367156 RepID=UPI0037DFC72E